MATEVLTVLSKQSARFQELENELVGLLGYLRFDFIKLLLLNRKKILFCTRLGQAQTGEEREAIEKEMMADAEGDAILQQLKGKTDKLLGGNISNRAKREQKYD